MEFRLVVESSTDTPSTRPTIQLEEKRWELTDALPSQAGIDAIPFICVSYIWGSGRVPNPFHDAEPMSDNTMPALQAAIRSCAAPSSPVAQLSSTSRLAFWIDALCVPIAPGPRLATLGSMGYIYARARSVIIIMPPRHRALLSTMQSGTQLPGIDADALLGLEDDEWIRSVWTYQEVVNSQELHFLCDGVCLDGASFFSALGHLMQLYTIAHGLSDREMAHALPGLDTLLEVLADWYTAGYTQRSALRVLCQYKYRFNQEPKNYFYAAIGAVVAGPWTWRLDLSVEQLADEFMDVCRLKNDYSFIYCSAPRRRTSQGRGLFPQPGLLQPMLIWHSWGDAAEGAIDGQRGRVDDAQSFWLENMVTMTPTTRLGGPGRQFLIRWLDPRHLLGLDDDAGDAELAARVLEALGRMAYAGSDRYIPTSQGLLYPQTPVASHAQIDIYIAAGVRWTFGAAALLRIKVGDDVDFVPGVFVGQLDCKQAHDVLICSTAVL
ncbi:MAG: hypothetical protein M1818_008529 [Claussenomyces sp. TS43310]|nr:MAG: hypothetical protein M1818_008529 [Claussenomyces sp. TS43310]